MDSRNIVLIILILAITIGGYVWYTRQTVDVQATLQSDTVLQFERALVDMRRLKEVTLDTSVLSDPFFRSLIIPTPVPDPSVIPGRPNPFLPF